VTTRAVSRVALVAAAPLALGAAALGVAVWPATASLATIVLAILVLAWRAPAWGLAAAVLLIGVEGSVKILLGLEPTPLPGGNRAVGAAAIDVALFAAVAGVVIRDRLATPRAIWTAAGRAERVVIVLLAAWLALSVLQIAQGGDIKRGLSGFRLFQAYSVVAVAAAVVTARSHVARALVRAVIAIGLIVGGYAALRVVTGPAAAEFHFVTSVDTVTFYGRAVRAVGSFSSAVGLNSYLTPLAVFGLVIGFLVPRVRWWAWAMGAVALVGLLGSYGRAPLFGIVLGLLVALAVVGAASDVPRRRKLVAIGLVVAVLGGTYGGVQIAAQASPQLRERAKGILNPFADKSVQLRFDTWKDSLRRVGDKPFGHGVGAAGSASAANRRQILTSDNSFLKVMLDQGIPVAVVFFAGIFGAVFLLARRLARAASDARAIGLAALAGFVAFLGISATGEYVEQPGKVVAWAMLGVAAAQALAPGGEERT
jgi:O-Antigen ligase